MKTLAWMTCCKHCYDLPVLRLMHVSSGGIEFHAITIANYLLCFFVALVCPLESLYKVFGEIQA